jgi:hypothetical protein
VQSQSSNDRLSQQSPTNVRSVAQSAIGEYSDDLSLFFAIDGSVQLSQAKQRRELRELLLFRRDLEVIASALKVEDVR